MALFGFDTTAEEVVSTFASNVKGRTFLITGASANGLGAYMAISLAKASPTAIFLAGRSEAKVAPVIKEIAATDPSIRATFIAVELTDQNSVRAAAANILADSKTSKIDVLINCAGIMYAKEFTTDAEGNELQFSANHIGHFLLTNLLLPKILAAGEGARIINVSSHGHQLSDVWWSDPTFNKGKDYHGWSGYGQSKTANILFSIELARRLKGRGVVSLSVHPGSIGGTGLFNHVSMTELDKGDEVSRKNTGLPFAIDMPFKTATQGCSSILAAALDPELAAHSGSYIQNCQVGTPRKYALDGENAKKLWAMSEDLVEQIFDL
ncbi:Retinol dehydrogenase 11 [Colletotrichum gloeosporioides]|uniref:Retinol dehydrogenase 11 n=1 Tax=Colletotrichum gloeosporioides TaxID=474922 RepID=A0A8H4CTF5_COLGL|nr:Retinol dehydrogenase 11 [Colletotrichum gloeosporioides]KAF3809624.1 Retinol dehydrogenase 11 [Colletotrichum gloeosporioides]